MKKIAALAAALMGLALVVGCSNGSSGGGYFGPALPAVEGKFAPAGKTFKIERSGYETETIQFGNGVVTWTKDEFHSENIHENTEYTERVVSTYNYSYNESTQSVYMVKTSEKEYIVRDDKAISLPAKSAIVSDEQFVKNAKLYFALTEDLVTDPIIINNLVRQLRYEAFSAYGYDDADGDTPLSDDIIKKINEGKASEKNLIVSYRYKYDGSKLFLVSDNTIPAGLKFHQLFNNYSFAGALMDGAVAKATIGCDGSDYYQNGPNIAFDSGKKGYLISFIDGKYIYLSKKGEFSFDHWEYSSADKNKVEWEDTSDPTLPNLLRVNVVDYGTIELEYAASDNIPDFSYGADVWKLVE